MPEGELQNPSTAFFRDISVVITSLFWAHKSIRLFVQGAWQSPRLTSLSSTFSDNCWKTGNDCYLGLNCKALPFDLPGLSWWRKQFNPSIAAWLLDYPIRPHQHIRRCFLCLRQQAGYRFGLGLWFCWKSLFPNSGKIISHTVDVL